MLDPVPHKVQFADVLRQLMDAAQLSGAELGRRLGGTNKSTISRWRSGEDRPEPDTVVQIADILGVDRLMLLRRAGYLRPEEKDSEQPTLNPRLSALLAKIEAGWLAMDSEAERELAERGALALFAVQPTRPRAKSRIDGARKSREASRRELLTGSDPSIENEPRRRKGLVTQSSGSHLRGFLAGALAMFGFNRDFRQSAAPA